MLLLSGIFCFIKTLYSVACLPKTATVLSLLFSYLYNYRVDY